MTPMLSSQRTWEFPRGDRLWCPLGYPWTEVLFWAACRIVSDCLPKWVFKIRNFVPDLKLWWQSHHDNNLGKVLHDYFNELIN